MKELFTMLTDPRFHLLYGVTQRFSIGPEPRQVRLNRENMTLSEGIRKKARVYPFMKLGTHPSPLKGDLYSPMFGVVSEINERSLFLEAVEPDEELRAQADEVRKVDVMELARDCGAGAEGRRRLAQLLKELGLNTKSLGQECETLIINGLNPDPGITWAEPMLMTHRATLSAGLALLRQLSPARKIILAVPGEMRLQFHDLEVASVPSQYPASVNELVVKAVTGKERPEGVGIVGLHNLWSLGRVAETGLPLVETVLTVGSLRHSGNYIVKDGCMVGELLNFAGIELREGDALVRGGPLRGESLDKLSRSVTRGAMGLFVVEAGTVPPMQGHAPCINCGACVLICPAHLSPNLLSRYAEFALHERARKEHVLSCLECGLCGYVCIARRPVLQYIRLARHKLAEADQQQLTPLEPVGVAPGNEPVSREDSHA